MSWFIAWISPSSIESSSVSAPAFSTASRGFSSSTCSTPSAARIATFLPFSSSAIQSSSRSFALLHSASPRPDGQTPPRRVAWIQMDSPIPMPEVPGVSHREVLAGDLRMPVPEAGPGEAPPLLLVHGWPQHWYCWNRVVADLSRDHRLLMPDLRGFGWSEKTSGGYEKEN